MKIQLKIPVKTMSVNAMFYGNRHIKTTEAREWTYKVFNALSSPDNQAELERFRKHFKASKHAVTAHLKAYYPKDILFTKQGQLSARAHDVTNWEKPIIDLIMVDKYHDKPFPKGCPNMNTDDKYLVKITSEKKAGEDYLIEAAFQVIDLKDLDQE